MKIAIRVDSSTDIGSGHLMRCLTLAERKQKENNKIVFIMRDLDGNLGYLVKERGFEIKMLPRAERDVSLTGYAAWLTVPQAQDAAETVAALKELGEIGLLVVDSYALDIEWERVIRPYVGEIFVIDDLANRKHDCDYLLDQNFHLAGETRYKGLVPEKCQLYLGYKYALLREEFTIAKRMMKTRVGKVRNILVFYGGSDLTDETSKALRALKKLDYSNLYITVIVGKSNPQRRMVAEMCHGLSNCRFLCQVNNMAELMAEADLALGAGGATTWERLYLELPSIVTSIADNQIECCEDCAKAGLISYLGEAENVTEEDIAKAVGKYINGD